MKAPNWLLAVFALCLFAVVGCKKRERYVGAPEEYYGVKVGWAKLNTEFANARPEVQEDAALAARSFRYAMFPKALKQLDQLANNPNLTDAQKTVVNDLIEQTKQVIAKAPPPAQ